ALTADWMSAHCAFVAEAWRRFPEHPAPSFRVKKPDAETLAANPELALRRYRQLQSVHILWKDLAGTSNVAETGEAISALARDCLNLALDAAESQVRKSCGALWDSNDRAIRLAIFGLGKLGGNELNFNSDIDIVLAYDGKGISTGPRQLDAGRYLQLVTHELIRLLDSVTASGRVWIVDTRLRPFGEAGALVWSLSAMEQYFLNEGRTWERYAWLKASPVAGDITTGKRLLDGIEPFIYRRYLDYGIFDSLRELHARIEANTKGEDGVDIKRGPDGIRAAEFLVQSQQILRGGRDRELRRPGFLPGLEACTDLGLIETQPAKDLAEAYSYLRILENRLQAMTGRQGHHLPSEPNVLERLAALMGCRDRNELERETASHQQRIAAQFSERFQTRASRTDATPPIWPPTSSLEKHLADLGFSKPGEMAALLLELDKRLNRRNVTPEGQRRLDCLMPELLRAVARTPLPEEVVPALLKLVEQISRRSAYLSLLHEKPQTLTRLVRVFSISERVSQWITQSPQLLDDLLDPVHGLDLPALPTMHSEALEDSLNNLSRWRQAGFLRTALAELDKRLTPAEAGEQLSLIAETVLAEILRLLEAQDSDMAIIAYGNLGARSLHYSSDLDLVFLHGADPPPVRCAQRLISLMQTPLPGGRLFEIDTRLRPNGRAGMLLSRINSFEHYQSEQAWTWEHQALIRARWIADSRVLEKQFEQIRHRVLAEPRCANHVLKELSDMRARQRRERSETPIKALMTDLQYIAEAGVLCKAADQPELVSSRTTEKQIELLEHCNWFSEATAGSLKQAWQLLVRARHVCWLQRHPDDADLAVADKQISEAWRACFSSNR
ncbi:MAG TPA: bifunctional [glutamate--ammonia ligase]-adenylyl-L-tyrosine phosphorylase/[glutamate--ammonia-ligase] adenylyltransferase, partial [Wenzhouxiangella sp.]|nr:bifunctional [glutamate--ammonia ligase]-adenylyl-L-tyrosine phosphorylase/[glutamate--ammonia-ligase] adenylyltransferase [Wenzhouxiangella sp.]